ncbi:hypothetical protein PVAP13_7KG279355 [Panicum virgatum]|uniref:Uncharacterized protein n=1 Tax=Panicum virgatum TaxID=38727 RepID=A0A8T0QJG4_PANVG|nr:hypothetical protein PVAP13_7KG279355 [Panicum virgatum]
MKFALCKQRKLQLQPPSLMFLRIPTDIEAPKFAPTGKYSAKSAYEKCCKPVGIVA